MAVSSPCGTLQGSVVGLVKFISYSEGCSNQVKKTVDINRKERISKNNRKDNNKNSDINDVSRLRQIRNSAIFPKFGQIRLRPNLWPNLADTNATAVRSISYLITDKN